MWSEMLAVAEGTAKQRPPEASAPPAFSALVAAWNESSTIGQHIESFKALAWPRSELILCAGGGDGSYARARALAANAANVTVIEQLPGQGKQAALRECLKYATHDLLYLTDADCVFSQEALKEVFAPIVSGAYQVSTGGSRPLPAQLAVPLVQYQLCRDAFYFDHRGDEADGVLGRNVAITRRCLRATGDFEEDVATGTDYHLSKKLKELQIAIAHASRSRVASDYPASAASFLKMWRRWIKNLMIHDAKGQWPSFAKSVVLAALLLFVPFGWLVLPWPLAAGLTLLFMLALKSRYRALAYCRSRGQAVSARTYLLLPYFTVLDQLAVFLAGLDLLGRSARARW